MGEDTSGLSTVVSSRARHRVLLVEDHELLAEATAELMQSYGLDVRIATTGRDALEIAGAYNPEIVLCDMRLEDMHGFEVARALRAVAGANDTLIAMHTAMSENDLRLLKCQNEESVDVFLSKPLTLEKLDTLLSQLEGLQQSAAVRRGCTK